MPLFLLTRRQQSATRDTLVRSFLITSSGFESLHIIILLSGPDHQLIAKLDRENEVAPPAKVAPSVGKVR